MRCDRNGGYCYRPQKCCGPDEHDAKRSRIVQMGIVHTGIASQPPGIIQQLIVIFDIFRPVFEML